MTSIAASSPPTIDATRSPSALILSADYFYLYLVLFTASGAVFRYGAINTWLWYGLYAWTLARLALEAPTLWRIAVRNWPVFAWPALALASIIWSLAPGATLRGGMQLLLTTVIAVFIGARFSLREIVIAVAVVLFAASAVSLALLVTGAPGLFAEAGGFQGVFAHKNTLGLRMNLLIAAALVMLFTTRMRLFSIVALILAAYLLFLSKSATSQILGLATPGLMLTLAILKLDAGRIALSFVAGIAVVAALAAGLLMADSDPVSFILDSFGKDATLTGRTWLWERGLEEIAKHPLIGGGYQAFWAHERSSEVMWIRHITLESVKGFHNVGVEVWNDLGIPGLIALVAVLIAYARRTFRFHLATPGADGVFPVFFLLILLVSASMNNSFFRQHELLHIMVCAFFAGTFLLTYQRRTRSVIHDR